MKICCEQLFYESLGFHRFSCQKFFIGLKKIGTGNFKLVKLCREQLISQIFTEKKGCLLLYGNLLLPPKIGILEFRIGETIS